MRCADLPMPGVVAPHQHPSRLGCKLPVQLSADVRHARDVMLVTRHHHRPGGGMPDWLRQIPGMKPRSPTQPYQDVCYNWMHRYAVHEQGVLFSCWVNADADADADAYITLKNM